MMRIFFLAFLSFLSCVLSISEHMTFNWIQVLAASLGASSLCIILFIYGRYFIFMRARSESKKEGFFSVIVLPSMPVYLFSLPYSGWNFLSWPFFALMLVAILAVRDPEMKLTEWLWRHRFHEFKYFSDDGVVPKSIINKYRAIMYSSAFLIPAAAGVMKGLYQ